jgi:hypothetical protein
MAWGLGAAKGAMKGMAVNAAVTGVMFGGVGYMTSDESNNKAAHGMKWATAAGIDIAADIGLTAAVGMTIGLTSPIGAGILIADTVTDMMGLDFSTAALTAMDAMDDSYDRMTQQGGHYKMSQGSAQAMQRQIQNLQGSGSNVAEMMHN